MTHIIDLQTPWQHAAQQVALMKKYALNANQRLYRISVVFVARGTTERIAASLQAILAQNLVREIILIDCSPQHVIEAQIAEIKKSHPRIFVLKGHPEDNLAKTYNLGLIHSTSKFVLFCASPYVLPQNVVVKLMQFGLPNTCPWLIGVQQVLLNGFDPFLRLGNKVFYDPKSAGRAEHNERMIHYNGRLDPKLVHAQCVMPECVLIAQEVIREFGLFDAACSDANVLLDFCIRMHHKNGEVYAHTELPSLPIGNSDVDCVTLSQEDYQFLKKSWHYYYRKHYPDRYRRWHAWILSIKLFLKHIFAR